MAKAGSSALFPDGELFETANELEVMAQVFRAMVRNRDPVEDALDDLCELLSRKP